MTAPTAGRRSTWIRRAALVMGALIAFLPHFRPWEVGFLEEWPLAEYWMNHGPLAFAEHYFAWSLSRPFHLVPTEIGLALAGGAPGGIFFVLGVIASGQFVMMIWAVRLVSRSFWISAAVALFVSLHPLWPAGYLQRYLPAQTAALALIITSGLLIRWLKTGRIHWIVLSGTALVLGLCVYPGPAVAASLLALVLALGVRAALRRRLIAVVVISGATALMTLYSLVLTRLINPGGKTYEAGNITATTIAGPREAIHDLSSALANQGIPILVGIVAIVVLSAVLALSGAIPGWAGWLMSTTAIVSPLCSLVFFGNISWLQDIDRIGYATSLGLIAAIFVWPITSRQGHNPRPESILATTLAVASILGAVRGVEHWQPYIQLQHKLLSELAPIVASADGDAIVVVIDHSGTYGSQYTLPQHYLNSASHVLNQDNTEVWLCRLASDPPLDSAGVCEPADTGTDLRFANSFSLPSGKVDIYVGRPQSNG